MEPPREGQTAINKRTGETAVFQQGQWVRQKGAGLAGAEQRSRLNLGIGPMVDANRSMRQVEDQKGGNPLQSDWGASLLDKIGLDSLAKIVGGDDYQQYVQGAKAWESQVMPIMSGAAVTPQEAERQIKASLPQFGDNRQNLGRKERTRMMIANGAAKSIGAPLPYPDVPTYGVNSLETGGAAPKAAQPKAAAPGGQRLSPAEAAKLPKGTRFIGQDGVARVRQ